MRDLVDPAPCLYTLISVTDSVHLHVQSQQFSIIMFKITLCFKKDWQLCIDNHNQYIKSYLNNYCFTEIVLLGLSYVSHLGRAIEKAKVAPSMPLPLRIVGKPGLCLNEVPGVLKKT